MTKTKTLIEQGLSNEELGEMTIFKLQTLRETTAAVDHKTINIAIDAKLYAAQAFGGFIQELIKYWDTDKNRVSSIIKILESRAPDIVEKISDTERLLVSMQRIRIPELKHKMANLIKSALTTIDELSEDRPKILVV